MRSAALTTFLLMIPCIASAAEKGESGFSFASSFAQMLGSLAVVLGLIYLITYMSRRWLTGGGSGTVPQSYIRVVETRHLAPKKSLILVEVGGEYLLLSNGSEGVSLIKQIDMLEEIAVIEVLGGMEQTLKGRFQDKLEEVMNKLQPPRLMSLDPRGGQ